MTRLLKRIIQFSLNRVGLKLVRSSRLDPRDLDGSGFPFRVDAFSDQLRLLGVPVHTIFDVGANVGETVQQYRRLFPTARVVAFEPSPDAFAQLQANLGGADRVTLNQVALSNKSGPLRLYTHKGHWVNSLLPTAEGHQKYLPKEGLWWSESKGTVQTEAVTLDGYCSAHRIGHVPILKLDIQGAELMALEGAAGMLAAAKIDLIYTEVLFAPLYEGQAYFCDLWRYLRGKDYSLFGLYNFYPQTKASLGWGDAIFVSPAVEKSFGPTAV